MDYSIFIYESTISISRGNYGIRIPRNTNVSLDELIKILEESILSWEKYNGKEMENNRSSNERGS